MGTVKEFICPYCSGSVPASSVDKVKCPHCRNQVTVPWQLRQDLGFTLDLDDAPTVEETTAEQQRDFTEREKKLGWISLVFGTLYGFFAPISVVSSMPPHLATLDAFVAAALSELAIATVFIVAGMLVVRGINAES